MPLACSPSAYMPRLGICGRCQALGDQVCAFGTREWVVVRTPYVIVYQVTGGVLEILHVWHGRQDWASLVD